MDTVQLSAACTGNYIYIQTPMRTVVVLC